MIKIINRSMSIPIPDRVIGYVGDNLVETRIFELGRFYNGIDLSEFEFRLDTEINGVKNIILLDKSVEDYKIILTWTIAESHILTAGRMSIQIRAFKDNVEKWHSEQGYVYVKPSINATQAIPDPLPSEFEQIEQRVTAMKNQAEQAAQTATEQANIAVEAIEEAKTDVLPALNQAIEDAGDMKDLLDGSIAQAGEAKEQLDGSITSAGDAKEALDETISDANTAKSQLDSSIAQAGNAKSELDGSITAAGQIKEALDESIQTGDLATFKAEVESFKNDYATLSGKISKRRLPVTTPVGFTWQDHPLKGKIFTDGEGHFWVEGFDVSDLQHIGAGKTYYVSPTGNDANDGLTESTPLKKISSAVAKPDVDIIMLADGEYPLPNDIGVISKSLSIKAQDGAKPIITIRVNTTSWAATAGRANVYQATRPGALVVLDTRSTDGFGDYAEYKKVATIDLCESTPGSYYIDGTTVYVHTSDNSIPNNSWLWVLLNTNYACRANYSAGQTLYLEGLTFYGGVYGGIDIRNTDATGTKAPKLYMKNVKQFYANTGDGSTCHGIRVLGAELVISQNCESAHNYDDGFNYHAQNGVIPKAIEINCVGRHNGTSSNTDNGSSSHEGGKVIRINGFYAYNKGPNIADVDDNTESWNLGCVSIESNGLDTQQVNFQAQDGAAKMWLDGCVSYGSNYSISVGNSGAGAKLYLRNCLLSGAELVGSGGTKQTY